MPCTFTGSIEGDRALFLREALDKMTDMLCRTCREIEGCEHEYMLPIDVADWWAKRKVADTAAGR